jgi:hypothetical protein
MNDLKTVAVKNLRSFIRNATFKNDADRKAANVCVDVLADAADVSEPPYIVDESGNNGWGSP